VRTLQLALGDNQWRTWAVKLSLLLWDYAQGSRTSPRCHSPHSGHGTGDYTGQLVIQEVMELNTWMDSYMTCLYHSSFSCYSCTINNKDCPEVGIRSTKHTEQGKHYMVCTRLFKRQCCHAFGVHILLQGEVNSTSTQLSVQQKLVILL